MWIKAPLWFAYNEYGRLSLFVIETIGWSLTAAELGSLRLNPVIFSYLRLAFVMIWFIKLYGYETQKACTNTKEGGLWNLRHKERKVIPKKILSFLQFRLVMTVRFILAGDGNQSISFLIWPESGQYRRHRAATEPFILLIWVQTRRGFCHRHSDNTFQIQWLQSITAPGAVSSLHTPGPEIAQQILPRRQHFLIIITILFEPVRVKVTAFSSDL